MRTVKLTRRQVLTLWDAMAGDHVIGAAGDEPLYRPNSEMITRLLESFGVRLLSAESVARSTSDRAEIRAFFISCAAALAEDDSEAEAIASMALPDYYSKEIKETKRRLDDIEECIRQLKKHVGLS